MRSPFRTERLWATYPAGVSVAQIVADMPVPNPRVLLGDQPVPPEAWPFLRPGPGASLIIVPVLQGGEGKSAQRTLLTIAVIAASAYTGGAAGAAYGSAWGAVASAATSYAGMTLVNQLAPPPELDVGGAAPTAEDQAAITGTRNEVRKYKPIPRVYGRHRVYPPYAAEPYTEIAGNDVYLRALFCLGYGPLDVSDIRIGETPIANFDYELQTRDLAAGDAVPTLYTNNVSTAALAVTLDRSGTSVGSWHSRTTEADTDEVVCDLTFPGGLLYVDGDGDGRGTRAEFNVQYAVAGSGVWTDAFVDPIGPSVSSPQQGILLVEHRAAGLFRRGFRITFATPGQYDIRIRYADLRNTSDAYRSSTGCGDSWNVKSYDASRLWAYTCHEQINSDWDGVIDTVQWSALRSIVHESPIDTDQFDQGVYLALRIKASGELNGVIEQLNCLVESKLATWNGSSWTAPVATRNPAWVYADMLTGGANKRAISTSRLDTTALTTWADNCDAEGRTFDYVFSGNGTLLERLRLVTGAARATWAVRDGLYSVVEDRAQTVIKQHLSPRNSSGFSATKVFADQPHALKVRFVNAAKDYQQDERIVYDDGYDASNATRFETLKLPGVTDADLAYKDGRYHIASARLRPETYTLNVDFEHLACSRGDLVRVSHDVMLVGLASGRIKSVTTDGSGNVTALTLDEAVPMESGTTYGIRIRLATGDSVTATVTTNPGNQTDIALSPAIAAADAPSGGELFQFGESGLESTPMLVKRIDPRNDLTATLTLIDYNAAVYTADQGTIPAFSSNITLPPRLNPKAPPAPTIDAIVSDETALAESSDGSLVSRIRIDFSVEQEATRPKPDAFQVEFRLADPQDDWVRLPNIPGDQRIAWCSPVSDTSVYDVRVRSVSPFGAVSDWVTESDHTVIGKTTRPPNVSGFSAQQNGAVLVLKWNEVTVKDLRGYEIRYGVAGASAWDNANTATKATRGTAVTDASVPPGTWDLFIKAIDTTGNESTTATKAANVSVISTYDQIVSTAQHPDWPGLKDGFVRHHTGVLIPRSQSLAADLDWEVFDQFVPDPVPTSTYIAPEQDSDYDDSVRIWADIRAHLGPGETGTIDYAYEIATRNDGGVYSGADSSTDFGSTSDAVTDTVDYGATDEAVNDIVDQGFVPDTEPWAIGSRSSRYVAQLLQLDNVAGNVVYLEQMTAVVDLEEKTEKHTGIVIAGGGTAVTFDNDYHLTPFVKADALGSAARHITRENTSATGCTFHVWDTSGSDVGGTIDYEVKGV